MAGGQGAGVVGSKTGNGLSVQSVKASGHLGDQADLPEAVPGAEEHGVPIGLPQRITRVTRRFETTPASASEHSPRRFARTVGRHLGFSADGAAVLSRAADTEQRYVLLTVGRRRRTWIDFDGSILAGGPEALGATGV